MKEVVFRENLQMFTRNVTSYDSKYVDTYHNVEIICKRIK